MKTFFVPLILACLCGTVYAQPYLDRVLLGDPQSEKVHGYTTYCPDYVKVENRGLMGETGRFCLQYPQNPYSGIYTGINGGEYQFVLKVDGTRQNYLTAKYSGSDTGYEIYYTADVDNKVLSDIDRSLITYSQTPILPGAFLFRTYAIPRVETDGKKEIVVRVRSKGRYYSYATPGEFTTYQRVLDQDMPPLYAFYSHTTPCLEIPADEKQGTAPSYKDAPAKPMAVKDLIAIKSSAISAMNQEVTKILNNTSYNPDAYSADYIIFLAEAYHMPTYAAYRSPKIVEKIKWFADQMVINRNNGKKPAEGEWGGAFGGHGYGLYLMRDQLRGDFMDKECPNLGKGTSKTRREQWIEALKASFDYGGKDRRTLTNQVMMSAVMAYGASLGLYALDSVMYANFPKIGHRFIRESAGLEYFTDDLKSNAAPDPQLGDYTSTSTELGAYYQVATPKGGTREDNGWVGTCCYGHMGPWMLKMWQMTRQDPYQRATGGDGELLQKIATHERLQSSLSYPTVDSEGYRTMLGQTALCCRMVFEPGKQFYGDLPVAAMTGDKALLGHSRQMYDDGQHNWDDLSASVHNLLLPASIDSLISHPECTEKLPATPGEPDFVVADEENGLVSFIHNGRHVYLNFFISMAQTFTKSYSNVIQFVPDRVVFFPSGQTSITKTEPYKAAHRVYQPDRPLLAGGGVKIELPSYNHSTNYSNRRLIYDFYQMWYDQYLVGMNTGVFDKVTPYDIEVPEALQGKTAYNLTTKEHITLGAKVSVPASAAYVLYVGESAPNSGSVLPEASGDPSGLKARADELTAFTHAHSDSITLSGLRVVNAFPHDKFMVFLRELTFANYAANCGTMSQRRLDSALVKLNEAYDLLSGSKYAGSRSDLPGKVDFAKRLDSGGRFTLDAESGILKNVYSTFMVFPVHATKEGFYTIVAKVGTKRNAGLNPRVNVTLFDERGYYADSTTLSGNTRRLVAGSDWGDYMEYTWDTYLKEGENKLLKLSVGIQSDILAAAQIESVTAEYKDFTSSDNAWLFQVPKDSPVLYGQFENQFAKKDPLSPWDFKTYAVGTGVYDSFAKLDAAAPKCEGIQAHYNKDEWLFIRKDGYIHPLVDASPAIVYTAPEDGVYCMSTVIRRQPGHKMDNYMYTRYRFVAGGIKNGVTSVSRDKFMCSDAYGHKDNNVPVSREFYVKMKKGDAVTFEEDAYTANHIGSGKSCWETLKVSKIPADRVESTIRINADKYYDYYGDSGIEEVTGNIAPCEIVAIATERGIMLYSTQDMTAGIYGVSGELVSEVRLGKDVVQMDLPVGLYMIKGIDGAVTKCIVK